jgi:Flp pilus assembly pilin Flp
MLKKLWNDESGIVTLEYLILATLLGLALIIGVSGLSRAINAELMELGNAILALSQDYTVSGQRTCWAEVDGSAAGDTAGSLGSQLTNVAPSNPSIIDVAHCAVPTP